MAIISENENGWGHCNLFQGLHALVVFFPWLWALHVTSSTLWVLLCALSDPILFNNGIYTNKLKQIPLSFLTTPDGVHTCKRPGTCFCLKKNKIKRVLLRTTWHAAPICIKHYVVAQKMLENEGNCKVHIVLLTKLNNTQVSIASSLHRDKGNAQRRIP